MNKLVFNLQKALGFLVLLMIFVASMFGFFILLPLIIPSILWLKHLSKKATQAFLAEYQTFLNENEGQEFFCYTSRKNSKNWIEQELLPKLKDDIEIIFLDGRTPISKSPQKFISHSLYRIESIGFPNVMKVVNGKMLDSSLHNELYQVINQRLSTSELIDKVHSQLGLLGK